MVRFLGKYLMMLGAGVLALLAIALLFTVFILAPIWLYNFNHWMAGAYAIVVDLPVIGVMAANAN